MVKIVSLYRCFRDFYSLIIHLQSILIKTNKTLLFVTPPKTTPREVPSNKLYISLSVVHKEMKHESNMVKKT